MKRILITGGAGMIGSRLARRLHGLGHEIYVADNLWRGRIENLDPIFNSSGHPDRILIRDLATPGALDDVLPKVEFVIHLADIVAGIDFVFGNQLFVFRQNLMINSHTFASIAQHRHTIKGLVYVGTACSYPKGLQTGVDARPLREDDMYPADPESAYGWSKLMGQIEAQLLARETGIRLAIPILHNVYGPNCDLTPGRSQVIPSLCRRIVETKEDTLAVWGSGKQGRAFVHVDDVVAALETIVVQSIWCNEVQIGPTVCTPIREIVERLVRISGRPLKLHFDLSKPEGDGGRCAEGEKALRELGWRPQVELEAGLRETYSWVERRLSR